MIESSPLAGKTVKIMRGQFEGASFTVEDFACNVFGRNDWIMNFGNPTVLEYVITHTYYPGAGTSVLYGKIGMFAHILDPAELCWEEMAMKPSEYWNDDRTEREFEECGLQCCTRTNDMGHRCGYVALPKGHPLFGKDWDKCYDIAPELEVDGGITFANGTDEMWILGWDAAHAWHRRDRSIASDAFRKIAERYPELYVDFDFPGGSYMVDADMAEHETRRFARQLSKVGELSGDAE